MSPVLSTKDGIGMYLDAIKEVIENTPNYVSMEEHEGPSRFDCSRILCIKYSEANSEILDNGSLANSGVLDPEGDGDVCHLKISLHSIPREVSDGDVLYNGATISTPIFLEDEYSNIIFEPSKIIGPDDGIDVKIHSSAKRIGEDRDSQFSSSSQPYGIHFEKSIEGLDAESLGIAIKMLTGITDKVNDQYYKPQN